MVTVLCGCGNNARARKNKSGHYIKCSMCQKRTKEYSSLARAREVWIAHRKKVKL